eukprot:COSAG04_NODE_424_length_14588_cov_8.589137_9_plen_45_part_00
MRLRLRTLALAGAWRRKEHSMRDVEGTEDMEVCEVAAEVTVPME